MLDASIRSQLSEVFSALTNEVTLEVSPSDHEDQGSLLDLLQEVSESSEKVKVIRLASPSSPTPTFTVSGAQSQAAIRFRGIPGGHEFSSLVLSILQVDGKSKRPDSGIISRIRALKGPIRLKTFVSLSCENCPDVVQSLNLIASIHPDFQHETIDGAVVAKEVEALRLQGVPSVMRSSLDSPTSLELLHSGKAVLLEILTLLEKAFGSEQSSDASSQNLGTFDVLVIGGGPSGSSAAIYSARKGFRTAIVAERLGGQLQDTKGIENMISVPYTEGARLSSQLSDHVTKYPVALFEHRKVRKISESRPFQIELESGERIVASSLIIATGAKWRQLGIPGEKEYIGRGVAFCAHCDGPFYKNKRVVVVGGGNSGVEAAIDLARIASQVTLLEYGENLKADTVLIESLRALPNVDILTNARSTEVIGDGSQVVALQYENRVDQTLQKLDVDGVFIQIGLSPNSAIVKDLVKLTPQGEIVVDTKGRTDRPGIYASGDVTTVPFKQIVIAMGEGAKAALTVFEDSLHSS